MSLNIVWIAFSIKVDNIVQYEAKTVPFQYIIRQKETDVNTSFSILLFPFIINIFKLANYIILKI